MRISVLTIFPEMFQIFEHSIIGKAKEKGIFQMEILNIRDFTENKHKKVDDYPYGGGAGMLMTPQPLVDSIIKTKENTKGHVIYLGPRGKTFNQKRAMELSKFESIIFVCGHYEGIDERVYKYIDEEISLGDFILTGGEMASIPIIDSILRLVPGVLSSYESTLEESFSLGLLEYPQYTRPELFRGECVPEILLSGHHENIRKWRKYKSLKLTEKYRRDLYEKYILSKEDIKILEKFNDS